MKLFSALRFGIAFLLCCSISLARADVFGSGANTFEIEFVPIYNPAGPAGEHPGCGRGCGIVLGNRPDVGGFGSVPYFYRMGKYEISEQMIDKANALDNLGNTHDGRGPDKPATSIDWFEAAQFVNWLNTSTGHMPAYKFLEERPRPGAVRRVFALWEPGDAGYNPDNLFRNRLAKYFLPSADEWYKAAYYDPTTPTCTWYDYPTGSDAPPTAVAGGTDPGTAVYRQDLTVGPADIFNAGGLSPYGTMAQGGNVGEWEETALDLINNSSQELRGGRGDNWQELGAGPASIRSGGFPSIAHFASGFRVASVPETHAMVLVVSGILGGLAVRPFSSSHVSGTVSPRLSLSGREGTGSLPGILAIT